MAKVSLRNYNREIETLIDRGQLDEAIAHCQHILKTFPKHLETYRLLGKAYLEYKRREEAADIFLRVLAAEPNDFVANVGMSIIRDEESKLDDAIWHMERAFEVQPSNPAIQAELQRLYGRRDGVQPPRIRMTRGALAHMYVQGELYPQAISEIKSVLKEDHGRSDMQALLARAYFRSGQKKDAAETANAVLRRYPYCLDANRVLVEVLGADRPENAQVYRQRVYELDPYAAQVTGTIFQSNEVSDNAVSLEPLDWNGQPVKLQSDWSETKAIAAESGRGAQEPDWLKSGFAEATPPPPAKPTVVPPVQTYPAIPEPTATSEPAAVPTPEEDIPEFLRAAGWGKSTGEFDESKSTFAEELESAAEATPIEQADLPDWVKEMMPQESVQPPVAAAQPTDEEELPDWIKNIGPGAVAATAATAAATEMPDWLEEGEPTVASSVPAATETSDWMQADQPSAEAVSPQPTDDLDWLKNLDQPQAGTAPSGSDDTLNWLQGLDRSESKPEPTAETQPDWLTSGEAAPTAQPDWLKDLEQPAESAVTPTGDSLDWLNELQQPAAESSTAETQPDWLNSFEAGEPAQPPQAEAQPDWMKPVAEPAPEEELDWLKGLGEPEAETIPAAPADKAPSEFAPTSNEFDFLEAETEKPTEPRLPAIPPAPSMDAEKLGTSQQEIDDSLAWLENLAAKQGATEGLLTKPEERLQEEPDWVKKIKGSTPQPSAPEAETVKPAVVAPEPEVSPEPVAHVEESGTSQKEIDDSLAWLENLAAKQGATEGLLTKPEERLQEEPEWVKKIKASTPKPPSTEPAQEQPVESVPPAQPIPAESPVPPVTASVEDLGKSQQEIDDSLAWLENLAAKQGATEGLLTKPEERLQEEPEWVKQAKSAPQEPVVVQASVESTPAAKVEDLGTSQQEIDDSLAWLENLAAKQGATEGLLTKPEERLEEEPEWVRQAKSAAAEPPQPQPVFDDVEEAGPDTETWIRSLDQQAAEPEPAKDDTSLWLDSLTAAETATPAEEKLPSDEMPDWLRSLEVEDTKPSAPVSKDATAMWLKDLEQTEITPSPAPEEQPSSEDVPAWLQESEAAQAPVAETGVPAEEAGGEFGWLEEVKAESAAAPVLKDDNLPNWLQGVDEEARKPATGSLIEPPAWLRDETGEALVEPTRIEPTRPSDWQPEEKNAPEPPPPQPEPAPVRSTQPTPAPRKPKPAAEPKPKPYREPATVRGTGMQTASVDSILESARNELSRSNIPGALDAYEKLIKKGRFLDEVIFDLREALYRYPVEISIWQLLGDAYMRANRLQDALDAYTKAEELLR